MKTKSKQKEPNSLKIYLDQINKYNLLPYKEQNYLAKSALEGDIDSKNKLINANLRFVVNVAKKYQNQGLPLEDLICYGNIGIINALKRYDVNRGVHFITYASWWIKQSITKAIKENAKAIRLPNHQIEKLSKIDKIEKMFFEKGANERLEEVAKILDKPLKEIEELKNISRELISLDTPVYLENDSSQLKEYIFNDKYKSPEEEAINDSLKENISIALEELSSKEAQVLEYRFGLNGKPPSTLKEIGKLFHLTKERIRQIEAKALEKLRKKSNLKDYLTD